MGLNFNATKCLLYARSIGVNYESTAMIGRQILYTTKNEFRENFKAYGYEINDSSIKSILEKYNGYSEAFFKKLGAKSIDSFDNSNYEDATEIHDFNKSIPEKYKGKYSVVFDGGSLEHIFTFPTAIKNCMEMIKTGGYYLALTPTNNWMGHGFYQFSPELYFRIFNKANGFELTNMIIYERDTKSSFYSVVDPELIRERVILSNYLRCNLFVIAQKVSDREIFSQIPMQTDYIDRWKEGKTSIEDAQTYKPPNGFRITTIKLLTKLIKLVSVNRGYDPKFFKKMDI